MQQFITVFLNDFQICSLISGVDGSGLQIYIWKKQDVFKICNSFINDIKPTNVVKSVLVEYADSSIIMKQFSVINCNF